MKYITVVLCLSISATVLAADPTTRPVEPVTQPAEVPAPPLQKEGWTLTFNDEFDGPRIDRKKWIVFRGYAYGEDELEYYDLGSYLLKDGLLRLIAQPVPEDQRGKSKGKPYISGQITSRGKFAQKYGWFEIRAKFPRGKGYWPAFWLLPQSGWPPEIDILEILGHEPATVHCTMHYKDADGKHQQDGHAWTGPDFSAGFHTFAVDWEPGVIAWYVDGIERARTESKYVPDEPMFILANLAVGGHWPGSPNADTAFPGNMDIDFIRVYQKNK